jgi:hypothetical protein
VRRHPPLGELRRENFQEQIEPLDQEAESHDRNRGTDPSEKGSFVGGVVAVALDHG